MNMYCHIYRRIVYSRNTLYLAFTAKPYSLYPRKTFSQDAMSFVLRSHHLCAALNYDPARAKEVARLAVAINVRRSKVRACRKGRKRKRQKERERQRDEKERDKVEAGRN